MLLVSVVPYIVVALWLARIAYPINPELSLFVILFAMTSLKAANLVLKRSLDWVKKRADNWEYGDGFVWKWISDHNMCFRNLSLHVDTTEVWLRSH